LTVEQGGPSQQQDPLTAARFSLVIDGVEIAAFSELVSIETEIETGAIAGADRVPASKQSRQNPLPNVTLRRPLTRGLELWAWHQTAVNGQFDAARKTVTLIMYGTDGTPIVRFSLVRAYPSSLEMSAVKAGASEVLYETVTLVCDSLQRLAPS
jgi:phage tail-like protein